MVVYTGCFGLGLISDAHSRQQTSVGDLLAVLFVRKVRCFVPSGVVALVRCEPLLRRAYGLVKETELCGETTEQKVLTVTEQKSSPHHPWVHGGWGKCRGQARLNTKL